MSEQHDIKSADYAFYNRIVDFVLAQHRSMPGFFGVGIYIATLGMSLCAVLQAGGTPASLISSRRMELLSEWRVSSIGPVRDLVRFYESLVVLALLSKERGA